MLDLSIVILHYHTDQLTKDCLESIFSKKWNLNYEVFVVDNGSDELFQKEINKEFPKAIVIDPLNNLGFSKGNNLAIKRSKGEYCLLLNSDTKVANNSLDKLFLFAEEGKYQIVSCKLINPDGSLQPNAGDLPTFWPIFNWLSGVDDLLRDKIFLPSFQQRNKKYYQGEHKVGWVSGSVFMVNKIVFEKIGLLDENIFMYGEDVEFCLKATRENFQIGLTDKAEIYHLGGGSSTSPKLNQWLGELRGLLYIFRKYYGNFGVIWLKMLIYIFVFLRSIIFLLLGRIEYTKTYAEILKNL